MRLEDDELIELVIEQINSDQQTGQPALYDFIDLVGREQMIIYLDTGLRETALERGIIGKGEVPNNG